MGSNPIRPSNHDPTNHRIVTNGNLDDEKPVEYRYGGPVITGVSVKWYGGGGGGGYRKAAIPRFKFTAS